MELELMGEKIRYYDVALDMTAQCEETMEAIVPDALPDIGSIVDAEGTVLVRNKEVTEGKALISGVVAATIIYAPDPQDCVKKLEMSIPFSCSVEGRGLVPDSNLVISCAAPVVEARMLNPRKVLGRANVSIRVTAYSPAEKEFCLDVVKEEEYPTEIKKESLNAYLATDIGEKTFSVIDEMEMTSSKPAIGEVLKSRVALTADDAKVIGNKVIFKGLAFLTLVYQAYEGDEIATAEFELPFSQIVELNHSFEEHDCDVEMFLTGCDISPKMEHGEGAKNISVSLFMAAQVTVWEEMRLEAVSDIYSTTHELKPEWGMLDVTELSDKGVKRQQVREVIEVPDSIRSIVDVYVCLGEVSVHKGESGAELVTAASVTLSYTTGDGMMKCAKKQLDVKLEVDCPADAAIRATAACGGETYAVPVSGGAEVRFAVDFSITCVIPGKTSIVTAANVGDAKDISDKPSVTLKAFTVDDSLWNLAKRYDATVDNILKANGMESNETPEKGQLLLIPRKRGK